MTDEQKPKPEEEPKPPVRECERCHNPAKERSRYCDKCESRLMWDDYIRQIEPIS